MNKSRFDICEKEGTVELRAFGELTISNVNAFRSHLLRLLQHGKQKSYILNLKNATAVDASGIELICVLKRELSAVNASFAIDLPDNSEAKTLLLKTGIL